MSKNVLVIGGGGREHAIVWKFSKSLKVNKVYVSPGSHAIQQVPKVENIELDVKQFKVSSLFLYKYLSNSFSLSNYF